jgi:hypothetical protein
LSIRADLEQQVCAAGESATVMPVLPFVQQIAHVGGGGPVGLADPVGVDAGDREAAVSHALADGAGLGDGAELGRHEVPQAVQGVVVAEPAGKPAEALAPISTQLVRRKVQANS